MKTIKTVDLLNNIKQVSDWLKENPREWITVARPHNENIVIMTEAEAHSLAKARRNTEYLAKLDRGTQAIENNDLIHISLEEMQAMEK